MNDFKNVVVKAARCCCVRHSLCGGSLPELEPPAFKQDQQPREIQKGRTEARPTFCASRGKPPSLLTEGPRSPIG
jgi:hypothetical protein